MESRRGFFAMLIGVLLVAIPNDAEARRRRRGSRRRRRAGGRQSASSAGVGGFANCSEARAAGAAPVRRGDPGYSRRLDRDGDGVGCER